MIGRLTGKLVQSEHDGTATVDVNGVGYDVTIPLGTLERASEKAQSEKITLLIHTHVREDAFELYGFSSELERRVFRLLLGVPNVGPKIALAVLSSLPAPDLVRAVVAQDMARLNKVSGVGKKTAERLILELKEKLLKLDTGSAAERSETHAHVDGQKLIGALTNMGYRSNEAERAVEALKDRLGSEPLSELLRAALAELSR
jgi:Holliday junction DNA helicase RuvA